MSAVSLVSSSMTVVCDCDPACGDNIACFELSISAITGVKGFGEAGDPGLTGKAGVNMMAGGGGLTLCLVLNFIFVEGHTGA